MASLLRILYYEGVQPNLCSLVLTVGRDRITPTDSDSDIIPTKVE